MDINDPTNEVYHPECPICEGYMLPLDDFNYECPYCGCEINIEPDWDSMTGGADDDGELPS